MNEEFDISSLEKIEEELNLTKELVENIISMKIVC